MIREFTEAFFRWVEETKLSMMRKHDKICPKCGGVERCISLRRDHWSEGCGQESALFSGNGFI